MPNRMQWTPRASRTPTPGNRIIRSLLAIHLGVSVDQNWNVVCPILSEDWGCSVSIPLRRKLSWKGRKLYKSLLVELQREQPIADVGKDMNGQLKTIRRFRNLGQISSTVKEMLQQIDSVNLLTRQGLRQFVKDDRFAVAANQMIDRIRQLEESGVELTDYQAGKLYLMFAAAGRMRKSLRSLPDFRR